MRFKITAFFLLIGFSMTMISSEKPITLDDFSKWIRIHASESQGAHSDLKDELLSKLSKKIGDKKITINKLTVRRLYKQSLFEPEEHPKIDFKRFGVMGQPYKGVSNSDSTVFLDGQKTLYSKLPAIHKFKEGNWATIRGFSLLNGNKYIIYMIGKTELLRIIKKEDELGITGKIVGVTLDEDPELFIVNAEFSGPKAISKCSKCNYEYHTASGFNFCSNCGNKIKK